jgi:hypothetical protein
VVLAATSPGVSWAALHHRVDRPMLAPLPLAAGFAAGSPAHGRPPLNFHRQDRVSRGIIVSSSKAAQHVLARSNPWCDQVAPSETFARMKPSLALSCVAGVGGGRSGEAARSAFCPALRRSRRSARRARRVERCSWDRSQSSKAGTSMKRGAPSLRATAESSRSCSAPRLGADVSRNDSEP